MDFKVGDRVAWAGCQSWVGTVTNTMIDQIQVHWDNEDGKHTVWNYKHRHVLIEPPGLDYDVD